jgi:hypothetical protein
MRVIGRIIYSMCNCSQNQMVVPGKKLPVTKCRMVFAVCFSVLTKQFISGANNN